MHLIDKLKSHFFILIILLLCFFINFPLINYGLPYFYDEDEAHHFDRQVEMFKTNNLNPQYFLKPSLNFYIRQPAIALGYSLTQSRGQVLNKEDIKTRDSFGIAGWSFTASHNEIVKANRFFSLLIHLGVVFLVYLITFKLSSNVLISSFASLLTTVSPLELEHSTSLGVNQPTAFLCLLCFYASLFLNKNFNTKNLVVTSILAGLAISTKYNALPIILVPLVALLLNKSFNNKNFSLVSLSSILAFFLASPFILIEIPLFIKHIKYEIWHYGVAGHEGNMANPGLDQFVFYISSFAKNELGILALLFLFLGIYFSIKSKDRNQVLLLVFPLAFFLMMLTQKANFIRNMLLALPFFAIISSLALAYLKEYFKLHSKFMCLVACCLLIQPGYQSYIFLKSKLNENESRAEIIKYLDQNKNQINNLAIDGKLWLPPLVIYNNQEKFLSIKGANRVKVKDYTLEQLFFEGYDYVLFGPYGNHLAKNKDRYIPLKPIKGTNQEQRIIKNPNINLIKLNKDKFLNDPLFLDSIRKRFEKINFRLENGVCLFDSLSNNLENVEFWLNSRINFLNLENCITNNNLSKNIINLTFNSFSPWASQKVSIYSNQHHLGTREFQNFNKLMTFSIPISAVKKNNLFIYIEQLSSPHRYNLSSDKRVLGIRIDQ